MNDTLFFATLTLVALAFLTWLGYGKAALLCVLVPAFFCGLAMLWETWSYRRRRR